MRQVSESVSHRYSRVNKINTATAGLLGLHWEKQAGIRIAL